MLVDHYKWEILRSPYDWPCATTKLSLINNCTDIHCIIYIYVYKFYLYKYVYTKPSPPSCARCDTSPTILPIGKRKREGLMPFSRAIA